MRAKALVGLVTGFLVACGESTAPTVTGAWSGATAAQTFSLTVEQRNHAFTGSGSMAGLYGDAGFAVSGTHLHPTVSMTWQTATSQIVFFQGTMTDGNTITGRLDRSGFDNLVVTFRR